MIITIEGTSYQDEPGFKNQGYGELSRTLSIINSLKNEILNLKEIFIKYL